MRLLHINIQFYLTVHVQKKKYKSYTFLDLFLTIFSELWIDVQTSPLPVAPNPRHIYDKTGEKLSNVS